jgi:hypothetical protein
MLNFVIAGSTRNPVNDAQNPRDCGSEAAMTDKIKPAIMKT